MNIFPVRPSTRGHASSRRTPVLALLSLLQFLIAVDVTVVNVALPAIGARFDADAAALSWVVTGYTLVGGGSCCSAGGSPICSGAGGCSCSAPRSSPSPLSRPDSRRTWRP